MPHAPSDTIAAMATPPGASALAVIRVSGEGALEVVAGCFTGARTLGDLKGFQGVHGWIRDAQGPVDEVVVWVYRAPHTFTGEDLVEISCHGGALPARRVLEELLRAGARPADPGEFTRRAFLNGRMDLTQAEAVADLIAAQGRRAQAQALAHLEGGLARRVRAMADEVRAVLARITVFLDFDEDVPEVPDAKLLREELMGVRERLVRLARSQAPSRRLRDGLTLALAGRPNVGKSSLLNALAGHDRAIVHETPGTTRDALDVMLEREGIPVRIVDTAGLREGEDPVEREGMERTRRALVQADLVLWVVDGSRAPTSEDLELEANLEPGRTALVVNKADLGPPVGAWMARPEFRRVVRLSALTGEGLEDLERWLGEELLLGCGESLEREGLWISNDRHAHELDLAAAALDRGMEILSTGQPVELAAADLQRSLDALAAITGDRASEDLLDEIFSRFCIGK